jgi:outer membrane protein assembly factor BamB
VGPDGTIIYGSMDGHLIGLDPATGDDRFRVDVGPGTFNSSTDVAGDMLAVGALHAAVTVASARTGEPMETIDLGETLMFATPAFDGRRVIAGTMDGRLVSIIVNAERSGE